MIHWITRNTLRMRCVAAPVYNSRGNLPLPTVYPVPSSGCMTTTMEYIDAVKEAAQNIS